MIPAQATPDDRTADGASSRRRRQGLAFASATWHFSTEQLPEEARGDLFGVERRYFRRVKTGATRRCSSRSPRRRARGRRRGRGAALAHRARHAGRVRPPARSARRPGSSPIGRTRAGSWDSASPGTRRSRDSGTNFFFEQLPGRRVHAQVPPARGDRRHVRGRPGRRCSRCTRRSSTPTRPARDEDQRRTALRAGRPLGDRGRPVR